MTWARTKIRRGSIGYWQLDKALREGRYAYLKPVIAPRCTTNADSTTGASAHGAPTGATGDVNNASWLGAVGSLVSQYHVLGTQTILAPVATVNGVNLTQDATDNDGTEHVFGGCEIATSGTTGPANPFRHTAGSTTGDSILQVKLRIADVSGTDDLCIGWRKQEDFQANVDDYNDAFFVNVNLGVVQVETIQTNAVTVTNNTAKTWADGESHTVTVILRSATRKCEVFFDLLPVAMAAAPTAYAFTAALNLIPFIYALQATTSPGAIELQELWVGSYTAHQEFSATGTDV